MSGGGGVAGRGGRISGGREGMFVVEVVVGLDGEVGRTKRGRVV